MQDLLRCSIRFYNLGCRGVWDNDPPSILQCMCCWNRRWRVVSICAHVQAAFEAQSQVFCQPWAVRNSLVLFVSSKFGMEFAESIFRNAVMFSKCRSSMRSCIVVWVCRARATNSRWCMCLPAVAIRLDVPRGAENERERERC